MSMEHLDSSTYYLSVAAASRPTPRRTPNSRCSTPSPITSAIRGCRSGPTDPVLPFQWEIAPVLDTIWFAEGFGQYAATGACDRGRHAEPGGVPRKHPGDALPAKHRNGPAIPEATAAGRAEPHRPTRYAEDFRTGRLVFSRGGLMAAAIDERIQSETNGAKACVTRSVFLSPGAGARGGRSPSRSYQI